MQRTSTFVLLFLVFFHLMGSAWAQQPNADAQRLAERISRLEAEAAKNAESNNRDEFVIAIIAGFAALIAALIGGGMTLLGQRMTAAREREREINAAKQQLELARQEAVFQHTEKILEFRIKQMQLFYAPMFALLEQSKALYVKLLHQLAQDEPKRYIDLPEPDIEGYRFFVILPDGTRKGFRLLDQLPAVRTNPKALALVERILEIGERMAKIISEHAGLASADIVDLLGEYLAHYAILSTIHKRGETDPYPPGWHKMGYYPRQLNGKIEEGYRELNRFLDEYAKAAKRIFDALPAKEGTT